MIAQAEQTTCQPELVVRETGTRTAVPAPLTPAEQQEYNKLLAITDEMRTGKDCGFSPAKKARLLKLRLLADAGDTRALLGKKPTGRPSVAASLSPQALAELKSMKLRCGSTRLSVHAFADSHNCPDAVSEHIKSRPAHAFALSLRRATHVTQEAEARFLGPRALQHISYKCRHNDLVTDPITKELRPLQAGDIFISDDMSRNRYFWFELPEHDRSTRQGRGDRLAEKHGVALGRQGLYTIDARGKWLGVSLIGCARDAYNAADVLRHFRQIMTDHGKPRIKWTLEKGVWASRAVNGNPIRCEEEDEAMIIGHISSLGFGVENVPTSEAKALIEGAFNHLQRIMSLYQGGIDIGRIRGEKESETKLIKRVQDGILHPRDAGVEHISKALENDVKAMVAFNCETKAGRIQRGVPDEHWIKDTSRSPLNELLPSEIGMFMPVKLETRIREGHVEKKLNGQSFRFAMPEIFGKLGPGYRLFICFDETNPEAGADIYNLETGSQNQFNWKPHHYIGRAEWADERTLCGWTDADAEDVKRRKTHQRAITTAYGDTGIFGKRTRKEIEQRDGKGKIASFAVSTKRDMEPSEPAEATLPDFSRRSSVVVDGPQPDSQTPTLTDTPVRRKTKIKSRLELMGVM